MWTREYIESLKEEPLCREVLIPLFSAMGFRGVTFTGGGILEQGKDVVMWRPEPPRSRVDYAAVVKAERISGKTATGVVMTQVKECLGRAYEDPGDHEERVIRHCFVVTSKAVPKEGTHTIGSLLAADHLLSQVTTIDGDRLWELVNEHLPYHRAASAMSEAYKILAPHDPNIALDVNVSESGATLTLIPKSGKPLVIEGELRFPEGEEGQKAAAAFELFQKTGAPVTLPGELFSGLQLPETMRQLFDSAGPPKQVRLGGGRPRFPLEFEFELEGPAGRFYLPHIDFTTAYGGSESVTLQNDEQILPFRLSMTIKADASSSLDYNFQFVGESVEWLLRHIEFEAAASEQAVFRLRSHRTFEVFEGRITAPAKEQRTPAYVELVKKLVEIQKLTRQVVQSPQRPYFTEGDLVGIDRAFQAVTEGEISGDSCTMTINPKREPGAETAPMALDDVEVSAEAGSWKVRVLDEELELGPVSIRGRELSIHPDDRARVEADLKSGKEGICARWTVGAKGDLTIKFARWHRPQGT